MRGLGLGLSIVERIGRVLRHPIGLKSNASRGSTFSVTVPKGVKRALASTEGLSSPLPGSLSGTFLVCIDNEPAVLDGMQTLLSGWGCRVLTAESADRALRIIESEPVPPDAVLADYHLDRGTGVDAILAIRARAGLEIPAVVITADHTVEVQREIRRLGFALLRKPLKAAALRAVLGQIVVRRAIAAE
ncbi:MAG: response regulator [Akkermansiaceae bacterium]|nr:response regulator [Akkermansiaceae bacterium]